MPLHTRTHSCTLAHTHTQHTQAVEGPLVPVEAVMDVIMFYRNTPEAVHYVCTELDAGRVPDGLTGASEGVEVPVIQAMTAPGRRCVCVFAVWQLHETVINFSLSPSLCLSTTTHKQTQALHGRHPPPHARWSTPLRRTPSPPSLR